MKNAARLARALLATQELGPAAVSRYALYRLGLASGYWKLRTPAGRPRSMPATGAALPTELPDPAVFQPIYRAFLGHFPQAGEALLAEAEEIRNGKTRLFGGPPVPILLEPPGPLPHWSAIESGRKPLGIDTDFKFIWEPARFGFAFTLVRASLLTGDDDYAQIFWKWLRNFQAANPANQGPNWVSAQEVALRLIALLFALRFFPPAEPQPALEEYLAAHARRIPPTLVYARAQGNNHLISEALGLYTAGRLMPNLPEAPTWREMGWKWLEQALLDQIRPDGSYAQHSANYHRLMLQVALWGQALAAGEERVYAAPVRARLAAAAAWLLDLVDPGSGAVWNLGSNDGARIFPLDSGGFGDYRATVQAACAAFTGQAPYPAGAWDEYRLWLAWAAGRKTPETPPAAPRTSRATPCLQAGSTVARLRAVTFHERPGHADQLHLDLWHAGHNIALDAGTYRYTAGSPWENALAQTAVHNTITLDDQDQMLRAGKFLWLRRAQAHLLENSETAIEAIHDGYLRLGAAHRRRVELPSVGVCVVTDHVTPAGKIAPRAYTICLHWLLPDWPWRFAGDQLVLDAPFGSLRLSVESGGSHAPDEAPQYRLARGGKLVFGEGEISPVLGWFSPTYSIKNPALSLQVRLRSQLPVWLRTSITCVDREA